MISANVVVGFLIFALTLLGAYTIYEPFLLPIAVAILLTMATNNLTKIFTNFFNSRSAGATAVTLVLVVIIFVPIVYLATVGAEYLVQLDKNMLKSIVHDIDENISKLPYVGTWAKQYFSEESMLTYTQKSLYYMTSLGSAGFAFIKNMVLVILFYFIINLYGEKIFELIQSLLPLNQTKSTKMINDVSSIMEVVFYSTIATAALEGLLFGIFIANLGYDGLLLGIVYGFASLIPVVGGALVWVPLTLYSLHLGESFTAWLIALYSIIMISVIADTFVKPVIIKVIKEDMLNNDNSISELVIFFSIVAGMSSYGMWGLIIGPAITSFLIGLVRVYIEFNSINANTNEL